MLVRLLVILILLMIAMTACSVSPSGDARRIPAEGGDDSLQLPVPPPQVQQKTVTIRNIQPVSSLTEPEYVLNHGEVYDIVGALFGVKDPVEPVLFDTLDNQPVYAGLVHGDEVPLGLEYLWRYDCWGCSGEPIKYWLSETRVSNRPVYRTLGANYFDSLNDGEYPGDFYVNWWVRADSYDDGDDMYPRFAVLQGTEYYHVAKLFETVFYTQGNIVPYSFDYIPERWHNIELVLDRSNDPVQAFAYVDGLTVGPLNMSDWGNVTQVEQIGYSVNEVELLDNEIMFGQIYVDNSKAKILICDVPRWSDREGAHCEIQVPEQIWDRNRIRFEVNQGSFGSGVDVYVYVMNSDGQVNANGHRIQFRGAPGGDLMDSCSDTDNGLDYDLTGCVVGFENGVLYEHCDTCAGGGQIIEYYCDGDAFASVEHGCVYPDNTTAPCLNGSCVDSSCSDTDGGLDTPNFGIASGWEGRSNFVEWEDASDRCSRCGPRPYRTVKEQYCDGYFAEEAAEECDTFCWQGECVDEIVPPSISCVESDGGINYDERGSISGIKFNCGNYPEDGFEYDSQDFCYTSVTGTTYLKEFFCHEVYDRIDSVDFECEYCVEGVCYDEQPYEYDWSAECVNTHETSCEEYCAGIGKQCGTECYRPLYEHDFAFAQFETELGCLERDWATAPDNSGVCGDNDPEDLARTRCCCGEPLV